MIYQPTFPSPYMETIDANAVDGNVFKCLINPKNTITRYNLSIKDENNKDIGSILCENVDGKYETYVRRIIDDWTWEKGETYAGWRNIVCSLTKVESHEVSTILPFKGSLTDDSWLKIAIPKTIPVATYDRAWTITYTGESVDFLTNGGSYSWCVNFVEKSPIPENLRSLNIGLASNGYEPVGVLGAQPLNKDIHNGLLQYVLDGKLWLYHPGINTYYRVNSIHLNYINGNWLTFFHLMGCSVIFNRNSNLYYQLYILDDEGTQTPDYYFSTRTTPTLEFNVPEVITSLSHNFTATYSQEQNSSISYYKFELYIDGDLIDETEEMYSSDISYTYGGLLNGKTYTVKLTVEDENGFVLNEERTFDVAYETYQSYAEPKVSFD